MPRHKFSPDVEVEIEEEEEREYLIETFKEEIPEIREVMEEVKEYETELEEALKYHGLEGLDIWFTVIPGKPEEEEE